MERSAGGPLSPTSLVKASQSMTSTSQSGPPAESTPLWKCLQADDVDGIQELLKQPNMNVNIRDSTFGWTPCHFIANTGNLKSIKFLLDASAKVEVVDNEGNTPLMLACRRGHLKAAEFLVGKRVNLDVQNNNGWTALIWAAINGHEDVCTSLMSANANYVKTDIEGRSACMWAARHGHLGIVELILACGINLGIQDHSGYTVMDHAHEHMEMRSMIVAVGVLNEELLQAAQGANTEGVRRALEAGANVELRDDDGWTPLIWAALHNSVDMVQLMIRYGTNPSLLDEKGEVVKRLSGNHVAVGEALHTILGSNSRLLEAAQANNWEAVEDELKLGAFVNVRDDNKRTVFIWAGRNAASDAMTMLIARNAFIDDRDVFGRAAVHYAVESRSVETVSMLFYLGANFAVLTFDGDSLLHIAVRGDDGPMIQLLLASNADLEEPNLEHRTPLMIAAIGSLTESIHTLLAYKADAMTVDAKKRTAFALAVMAGQFQAVSAMLEPTPLPLTLDGKAGERPAKPKKPTGKTESKPEPKKADTAVPNPPKACKDSVTSAASGIAKRKKIAPAVTAEKRGDDPKALITAAVDRRADIAGKKAGALGKVLLKQADLDLRTPLALSVVSKSMPIFHRLLEEKANPEASNALGNTVLMEAVTMKQREAVARLLELKVKDDTVNKEGKSVMDLCEDGIIREMLNRYAIAGKLPESTLLEDAEVEGELQADDRLSKVRRVFRIRMEHLSKKLTGELLEESIRLFVRKLGAPNLLKIEVGLDPITSRPRGYAYLDFADAASADLAMCGDGQQLSGQVVRMLREHDNTSG